MARGTKRLEELLAQEGSGSDDEHHALATVQAWPQKSRYSWTKVPASRAFLAMELAPDSSKALHSQLDTPEYDPEDNPKPVTTASAGAPRREDASSGDEYKFDVGTTKFLALPNRNNRSVLRTTTTVAKHHGYVF